MKTLDQKYDDGLKTTLETILKRPATVAEITNSENDTDLTVQVMWNLLKELDSRITILEKDNNVVK